MIWTPLCISVFVIVLQLAINHLSPFWTFGVENTLTAVFALILTFTLLFYFFWLVLGVFWSGRAQTLLTLAAIGVLVASFFVYDVGQKKRFLNIPSASILLMPSFYLLKAVSEFNLVSMAIDIERANLTDLLDPRSKVTRPFLKWLAVDQRPLAVGRFAKDRAVIRAFAYGHNTGPTVGEDVTSKLVFGSDRNQEILAVTFLRGSLSNEEFALSIGAFERVEFSRFLARLDGQEWGDLGLDSVWFNKGGEAVSAIAILKSEGAGEDRSEFVHIVYFFDLRDVTKFETYSVKNIDSIKTAPAVAFSPRQNEAVFYLKANYSVDRSVLVKITPDRSRGERFHEERFKAGPTLYAYTPSGELVYATQSYQSVEFFSSSTRKALFDVPLQVGLSLESSLRDYRIESTDLGSFLILEEAGLYLIDWDKGAVDLAFWDNIKLRLCSGLDRGEWPFFRFYFMPTKAYPYLVVNCSNRLEFIPFAGKR